jgi:CubicO group peptidase (beta-lactamase class C family)
LVLLFGAIGAGCQPSATPTVSPEELPALLDSLRHVYEVPGVQVCLFRADDLLLSMASGRKDARDSAPVEVDTRFEAASLSKPVFVYLLHQLEQDGCLPPHWLRRPICEWIDFSQPFAPALAPRYRGLAGYTDFRPGYERASFCQITAYHLLTHQSGLGDWWDSLPQVHFPPGRRFRYSDDGYLLLQRLVEAHTGVPLQTLLIRYLPRELAALRVFSQETLRGETAPGHERSGAYQRDSWRSEEALAHGTLLCSAEDYATFMQHVAQNGLFPPSLPRSQVSQAVHWTIGWGLDYTAGDTAYWHWGNDVYYQHLACYDPQRDLGLVVMTNAQRGLALIDVLWPYLWGHPMAATGWVLPK